MVHGGTVLPLKESSEGSAGIRLLVGGDLPDHNRVSGFGVGRTIGDEVGFALELVIEAADVQQGISFWVASVCRREICPVAAERGSVEEYEFFG